MKNSVDGIIGMDEFLTKMFERTQWFFGPSELVKIQNQTIALAGLGGIGALVLELLARIGVKKFRIMDMDIYEPSNMNRQVFATSSVMGSLKVDVATARVKDINPSAQIEMAIAEKANRKNTEKFIKGADILIVETDTPSSKVLFREFARTYKVPLINGHCVLTTGGAIRIFDYRNSRQFDGDRYFMSPILNSITSKLLGKKKMLNEMTDDDIEQLDKGKMPTASLNFVTNLIACIVVSETVKLVTGRGPAYHYPKEIRLDVPSLMIKVRSARSIASMICKLKDCVVAKPRGN